MSFFDKMRRQKLLSFTPDFVHAVDRRGHRHAGVDGREGRKGSGGRARGHAAGNSESSAAFQCVHSAGEAAGAFGGEYFERVCAEGRRRSSSTRDGRRSSNRTPMTRTSRMKTVCRTFSSASSASPSATRRLKWDRARVIVSAPVSSSIEPATFSPTTTWSRRPHASR